MTQEHEKAQALPESVIASTSGEVSKIDKSPEMILARSLIRRNWFESWERVSKTIAGVKISFPGLLAVKTARYDDALPQEIWDEYDACGEVMDPKTVPQAWKDFLKEADKLRLEKGANISLDPIQGLSLLSHTSERYKLLGISKFEINEHGVTDYTNVSQMRVALDKAIADPQMRQELIDFIAVLVPDIGQAGMNMKVVAKILASQDLGFNKGILLDLGCGLGERTLEWRKITGMETIGLERVYKDKWYDPIWHNPNNEGVKFIQADFTENIPLAKDSVDSVIMECVTPYVLEDKLASGILEITRVLKPDTGFLFVGPQNTSFRQDRWRMFKKEKDPKTEKYGLIEHSFAVTS